MTLGNFLMIINLKRQTTRTVVPFVYQNRWNLALDILMNMIIIYEYCQQVNLQICNLLSIKRWVVTFFQVVQSGWSLFSSRSKAGGHFFPMISENRMTRPSPGINYDQAPSIIFYTENLISPRIYWFSTKILFQCFFSLTLLGIHNFYYWAFITLLPLI